MRQSRYTEAEVEAYMASTEGRADKAAAFAAWDALRDAEEAASLL